MEGTLHVFRDNYDSFQLVGTLEPDAAALCFRYDAAYDGPAVSLSLPLQDEPFSPHATEAFFSGLVPEGDTRASFIRTLRTEPDDFASLLARLNDESAGGLVFSTDRNMAPKGAYVPVEEGFFERFAARPQAVAVETMGKTRLSLSGAVAKVGLYRNPETGAWYYPEGTAPSTHIVKAGSDLFPYEVINEALCMGAAKRCGYPVADCEVIDVGNGKRLLAVERFDRVFPENYRTVDGAPRPFRLHQEDLCQAKGWKPHQKYEPTEGGYLEHAMTVISRSCANAFGERSLMVSNVLFDYLVGNCDNHLKNYSLLLNKDWAGCELSPRYDILSTVLYPNLYTEMGISLSASRSIVGLTKSDVVTAIERTLRNVPMGMASLNEDAEKLPDALSDTAHELAAQGMRGASRVADLITRGVKARAAFEFDTSVALSLQLDRME